MQEKMAEEDQENVLRNDWTVGKDILNPLSDKFISQSNMTRLRSDSVSSQSGFIK